MTLTTAIIVEGITQLSSQIPHSVLVFSSGDGDMETSQLSTNGSSPPRLPECVLTFSYCDSDEEPSEPCTRVTEAVATDHDYHVIIETTAVSVEPTIPETVLDPFSSGDSDEEPSQLCTDVNEAVVTDHVSDMKTSQLSTNGSSSSRLPVSVLTFSYCDSDEEPSQPCTGVTEAVVTDHYCHVIIETTAVSVEPTIPETVFDPFSSGDSDEEPSQSCTDVNEAVVTDHVSDMKTSQLSTNGSSSSRLPVSVLTFSYCDSDKEPLQTCTGVTEAVVTDHDYHVIMDTTAMSVEPTIPKTVLDPFSSSDSDEEPSQPCTGVTEAVVTDHDTHVILETTAVSVEPVIPQTVLDQHCCDSDVSVSQSSTAASQLTASSLKCLLNDIDSGSFLCVESSRYVTFVQLTDELVPAVRIAFVIDEDCAVHISVSGKPIDEHHTLWQQVPKVVSSKDDVVLILYVLSNASICSGSGSVNLFNESILKNTSSYVEQQSSCVRSTNCSLLSGGRCKPCSKLKKQLMMRKHRQLKCNDTSSNLPNKFLSPPFIHRKLTNLGRIVKQRKHRNNALRRQLKHYKSICKNVVTKQRQKLTVNMMQLATECTDAALKQFTLPVQFIEYFGNSSCSTTR